MPATPNRLSIAATLALAPDPLLPADARHPNTGKRKASKPNRTFPRTTAKRGALRSSVTVIRVDPATLRASRARTRTGNVSDAVIDAGTVVARSVKSRSALRKLAANA